jgi:hypothetical protein
VGAEFPHHGKTSGDLGICCGNANVHDGSILTSNE